MIAKQAQEITRRVPQRRLFFALWPGAATRAALVSRQAGMAGKLTPPEKLHLTLAFLGQRADSDLPALCAILDSVAARPLELKLDTYGYFAAQQLVWAGMRVVAPDLLALRGALMRALAEQRFCPAFEHDRYTPHVTLARKAAQPAAMELAPLSWRAERMVLAESHTGSGTYRILAERRLA